MKKVIRIIFLLAVMSFVFYMSSQNAYKSNNYNEGLVNLLKVNGWLDLYGLFNKEAVDIIIRKLGHFTEFSILSISLYMVFSAFKVRKVTILTCIICIFFAITDEFHQMFILGRSSEIRDVIIDSIGVLLSVGLISFIRIVGYELSSKEDKYSLKKDRNM